MWGRVVILQVCLDRVNVLCVPGQSAAEGTGRSAGTAGGAGETGGGQEESRREEEEIRDGVRTDG